MSQGRRSQANSGGAQFVRDVFAGADCVCLRTNASARFRLDGVYALQRCASGGWVLHAHDASAPSYWLPASATLRRISAQGHILEERAADLDEFDLDSSGVAISFSSIPEGWMLDAVIWKLADASLH